jgi:uncharacterized membrane protein
MISAAAHEPARRSGAPDSGSDPNAGMTQVVNRNIRALMNVREEFERRRTVQNRVADAITAFAGTMWFVYLHAVLYGGWIVLNLGVLGLKPWDPFPFVMLAMAASVEAIFLSTFILISQNRMAKLADRRADLDLQISLLAEHELTRLIELVDAVARKVGVTDRPAGLEETKKDVAPERVVEEIERADARFEKRMAAE